MTKFCRWRKIANFTSQTTWPVWWKAACLPPKGKPPNRTSTCQLLNTLLNAASLLLVPEYSELSRWVTCSWLYMHMANNPCQGICLTLVHTGNFVTCICHTLYTSLCTHYLLCRWERLTNRHTVTSKLVCGCQVTGTCTAACRVCTLRLVALFPTLTPGLVSVVMASTLMSVHLCDMQERPTACACHSGLQGLHGPSPQATGHSLENNLHEHNTTAGDSSACQQPPTSEK